VISNIGNGYAEHPNGRSVAIQDSQYRSDTMLNLELAPWETDLLPTDEPDTDEPAEDDEDNPDPDESDEAMSRRILAMRDKDARTFGHGLRDTAG